MNWVEVLAIAVLAQGLILALILVVLPSPRRQANALLAVLLLTFCLRLLAGGFIGGVPAQSLLLLHNVSFLLGPLLWLYSRALTEPRFRLSGRDWLHGVPAVLASGWMVGSVTRYQWPLVDHSMVVETVLHGLLASASVAVYCAAALRRLWRYRRALLERYSAVERIDLGWLRGLVAIGLGVSVAAALINLVRLQSGWSLNPVSLAVLPASMLLFLVVAVHGFRQSQLLLGHGDEMEGPKPATSESVPGVVKLPPDANAEEAARYQRSGQDSGRLQRLWERLQQTVAEERLWADPDLDLSALAEAVGVSPQVLSEVLNVHAGVRFYDFINRQRVQEAQKLLRDPGHAGDSILDIALSAGFSSKSTFNKYFRRETGLTPSVYRSGV